MEHSAVIGQSGAGVITAISVFCTLSFRPFGELPVCCPLARPALLQKYLMILRRAFGTKPKSLNLHFN